VQLAEELLPLLLREAKPGGFLQKPKGRRLAHGFVQVRRHLLRRREQILYWAVKDLGQPGNGLGRGRGQPPVLKFADVGKIDAGPIRELSLAQACHSPPFSQKSPEVVHGVDISLNKGVDIAVNVE
jgi:hypothetical protein